MDIISEFGVKLDSASGPDAFFGEISLTDNVPRTASVMAKTACVTLVLAKEAFNQLAHKFPEIAKKIKSTAESRMQAYLERNVLA